MNPIASTDPTAPFDIEVARKVISDSLFNLMKLMMPIPGASPDPSLADSFMTSVTGALATGSRAISEVQRIRADITQLRDTHRPRPHADPTTPGALCEACSLGGSLASWPCATWTAADRILSHGTH